MYRSVTSAAVVIGLCSAAVWATQDPPPPGGQVRLYVSIDPSAKYSVTEPKLFSRELEIVGASGGTLVGRTDKGHVVIDVPSEKKAAAKQNVMKTAVAKKVADIKPASAGPVVKVTRLIVKYNAGQKPTPDQLEQAGLKPVPGKESDIGNYLVAEAVRPIDAVTVKGLKGIESVTYAEAARALSVPPLKLKERIEIPPAKGGKGDTARPVAAAKAVVGANGLPTDPFFPDKMYGLTRAVST